jgi:hypothetical protein
MEIPRAGACYEQVVFLTVERRYTVMERIGSVVASLVLFFLVVLV